MKLVNSQEDSWEESPPTFTYLKIYLFKVLMTKFQVLKYF